MKNESCTKGAFLPITLQVGARAGPVEEVCQRRNPCPVLHCPGPRTAPAAGSGSLRTAGRLSVTQVTPAHLHTLRRHQRSSQGRSGAAEVLYSAVKVCTRQLTHSAAAAPLRPDPPTAAHAIFGRPPNRAQLADRRTARHGRPPRPLGIADIVARPV